MKGLFFYRYQSSFAVHRVLTHFRGSFDSEVQFFITMSCRRMREEKEGDGGVARNGSEDEGWSLWDEEESDMGEGRTRYKKHEWVIVEAWSNIDIEEAYLRADKIMTGDFDVAGGLALKLWPSPCEKKIGPFHRKSESRGVLI